MQRNAPVTKHLAALPLALTALMVVATPVTATRRTVPLSSASDQPKSAGPELELWTFYHFPRGFMRNQLGIAYSLGDRLNVVLFGVVTNLHTDARKFRALKLQCRYRFAAKNVLPVDMAVHLDYEHPLGAGEAGVIGGRFLLEKRFGAYGFTSNMLAEKGLDTAKPFEFGTTLGGTYAFSPSLKLGVESRYIRIGARDLLFIGPIASLDLGRTRLVGGVSAGNRGALQGRLIIAHVL